MIKKAYVYICATLLLGPVADAIAQTAPTPEAVAPQAPAEPAAQATATPPQEGQPTLADHQLPRLVLRWDCGDCEQNDKVFPLIEQTYASRASAKGYTISDSETAELVVTKYRQRPPGARVMFGFMAGKDILETRVSFRGTSFVAGDYAANAWHGMNSLCETVAQQTLDQLLPKTAASAPPATPQQVGIKTP